MIKQEATLNFLICAISPRLTDRPSLGSSPRLGASRECPLHPLATFPVSAPGGPAPYKFSSAGSPPWAAMLLLMAFSEA